ncbi:hypothetical protein EIP86_006102 [Pleurotus ostreatoroseus]|nr:hypothetical protein EIP86_006102 [Pleurotus ostreatoroseus]
MAQGRDEGQEDTPRYQGTEEHLLEELDGLLYPGKGFKGFGGLDYLGTGYKPYVRPECTPQRTLSYPGVRMSYEPDEIDLAILDAPRTEPVERLHFGKHFDPEDRHLDLIAARPAIMASLKQVELGCAETRNGDRLTDAAVQAFLAAMPNLRILTLDSCFALTNATIIKALESCPLLESVRITGYEKVPGSILPGKALREMKRRKTLGQNLKEIVLLDQSSFDDDEDDEAMELTKMRKGLAVKLGRTVGNGLDARMIAAENGGETIVTNSNGRCADMQVDDGRLENTLWW